MLSPEENAQSGKEMLSPEENAQSGKEMLSPEENAQSGRKCSVLNGNAQSGKKMLSPERKCSVRKENAQSGRVACPRLRLNSIQAAGVNHPSWTEHSPRLPISRSPHLMVMAAPLLPTYHHQHLWAGVDAALVEMRLPRAGD